MKILQVKSSLFSGNGQSSRLADEFVALLGEQHPAAEIVERDLRPHLCRTSTALAPRPCSRSPQSARRNSARSSPSPTR